MWGRMGERGVGQGNVGSDGGTWARNGEWGWIGKCGLGIGLDGGMQVGNGVGWRNAGWEWGRMGECGLGLRTWLDEGMWAGLKPYIKPSLI